MKDFKTLFVCLGLYYSTIIVNGQTSSIGCRRVLDIVFTVDGSDSITKPDFEKIKASLDNLTRQLDIGSDKIWLGLVLYSSSITEVINLQGDKQEILRRISLLKHARMGTDTALGVLKMDEILRNGRTGVPKMGVVITDGLSLDPDATRTAAVAAKADNINMFSVGVGSLIDQKELQDIASPGSGHLVTFQNFDSLSLDKIAKEICPTTTTTTTTSTTTTPTTTTTTTTTATTPTRRQPIIDPLCAGCLMRNGAGYNSHPTDCNKFIQCRYNQLGDIIGTVKWCRFPTFWSMGALTCVNYYKSDCNKDKCAGVIGRKMFADPSNCRGYWECNDSTASAICCQMGYMFDQTQNACVRNSSCHARCTTDPIVQYQQGCDLVEVKGYPSMYRQKIGRGGYMNMPCAPGTAFSQAQCACTLLLSTMFGMHNACRPEIYLPFSENTRDASGNGNYISNHLVNVNNGVGQFSGKSQLIIPRFTNLQNAQTLVIKVKYTSATTSSSSERAILSNSDCGNVPSILITEDNSNIYFSVGLAGRQLITTSVPRKTGEQDVTYTFDLGRLIGSNGAFNSTVWALGSLNGVKCALHIGYANGYDNFVGEIEELAVFLCNPNRV